MGFHLFPAILLTVASTLLAAPGAADSDDVVGHLEVVELKSSVFGNTRKLRVWVPYGDLGSSNTEARFPVLYLNDGQDVFEANESLYFSSEWRVDETVSWMIADG